MQYIVNIPLLGNSRSETWFLKAAGAADGVMVDPAFFDTASDLGAQYIAAMQIGGTYAYAGRD
jgi:tRNA-splicing ligase RtcB